MDVMKIVGFGVLAAVLFFGQSVWGYVYHEQVQEGQDNVLEELNALDIVWSSMFTLDEDIIRGHGCTPDDSYYGVECPRPYGGFIIGHLAINLYSSLQMVQNGYVVKDGDEVCADEVVEAEQGSNGGEWFVKGGPTDSPPIQWMSCTELKGFLTDVVEWHKTNVYPDDYRTDIKYGVDSYVVDNNVINRDDIIVYPTPNYAGWRSYLSVLCCQSEDVPLTKTDDDGKTVYNVNSKPVCIMYIDGFYNSGSYQTAGYLVPVFKPFIFGFGRNFQGYLGSSTYFSESKWIDEYFETSLFDFSHSKRVSQVSPLAKGGSNIEMLEYDLESSLYEYDPLYVRVQIENTGDMKLHIDDVSLNVGEFEVIYAPKSLDAGNKSEIIIETAARDISSLELSIDYFSDKLGCLNTKDFSVDFSLGSVSVKERPFCKETGNCAGTGMDNAACCRGACYDLGRGSCDDYDGDGSFEWSYY